MQQHDNIAFQVPEIEMFPPQLEVVVQPDTVHIGQRAAVAIYPVNAAGGEGDYYFNRYSPSTLRPQPSVYADVGEGS